MGKLKPKLALRYDYDETQTYLAHRVPGIYSTVYKVFYELEFKLPSFKPLSMLDFGSGPGTAVIAAHEVWNMMQRAVTIEPSEHMHQSAVKLLQDKAVEIERRRYLLANVEKEHDLVVSSYALTEVQDPVERMKQLLLLWDCVKEDRGLLVLVEPGTPVGFKTIKDARDALIKAGANIIAPCPHAYKCPMPLKSWCHFKQRTLKTPLQMETKLNKTVNYTDEKYSYLVVGKGELADDEVNIENSVRHRVLKQPSKNVSTTQFCSLVSKVFSFDRKVTL